MTKTHISLRIHPDLDKKLRSIARKNGTNLSLFIREAVEKAVNAAEIQNQERKSSGAQKPRAGGKSRGPIPYDLIEQRLSELLATPPKKRQTVADLLAEHLPQIAALHERGFSALALAEACSHGGRHIAESTMRKLISDHRKSQVPKEDASKSLSDHLSVNSLTD